MAVSLIVENLSRTTAEGKIEELEFSLGVNVIVGAQNSGKSTWLRMLDYLMDDTGSPNKKFDTKIVEKYRSIAVTFRIADQTYKLQKQWEAGGERSKATLDDKPLNVADIQEFLLTKLGIPILRYPQGNVYASDRGWPTLGWRSLLRHIYRRQECWGELIPQQPDSEQHACMLQFLGIAEYLFSDERAVLVDKQKRVLRLEHQKDFFVDVMNQIAPGIVGDDGMTVGITLDSLEAALVRIRGEIGQAIEKRTTILKGIRDQSSAPDGQIAKLMEERAVHLHSRGKLQADLADVRQRSAELQDYQKNLQQELARLERVDAAAAVFDNIRITTCPACDQSVQGRTIPKHNCFLCGQGTEELESTAEAATRRLKFERDRIGLELAEASDLIKSVSNDEVRIVSEIAAVERQIRNADDKLRPFQASVSAVVPEEVALIDQNIGSLNAQSAAVERLREPLATRNNLSSEIDKLRSEIRGHESSLAAKEGKIELETASDRMSESFNTYLNALRKLDQASWTKSGTVVVHVTETKSQYLVDKRPYRDQLGGTLTLFFLFAYQYALLTLTRYPDCHYPGLTVMDLFADIAKEHALRDRIGLVLQPFIDLVDATPETTPLQVIATSRDFDENSKVNLIRLTQIWR